VVTAVACEDHVPGQSPLPSPLGVHLGSLQDPRRALHEGVREVSGPPGLGRVGERLAARDLGLEGLERDPERALLPIGRVGVRDLGRERALVGAYHEHAAMLDRGLQDERGAGEAQLLVHLGG
jgi:hypothetical protein